MPSWGSLDAIIGTVSAHLRTRGVQGHGEAFMDMLYALQRPVADLLGDVLDLGLDVAGRRSYRKRTKALWSRI